MKFIAILALALVFPALGLAADDEAQSRLDAQAQSCVTSNVAEVVRAEPNLSSAVDFLTNDLCAHAIEVAEKYRLNRKVLDILIRQQKTTMATMAAAIPPPQSPLPTKAADGSPVAPQAADKAQKATAKDAKLAALDAARINPETGELEGLPAPYSMMTDLANLVLGARASQASAKLKAFAAHAVLAARESMR
ncbi:MAG TPA: hypothetical protein VGF42_03580 [Caulobacteraceae bacterium]|jgi:hypothetical protein